MELVTPGIGLLFWMLIMFSAVLFILGKFAWKPILQILKERETTIEEALNSAKKAKEEMTKLQEDNRKIITEAKLERDVIIKEAREIKDKMIAEAKKQAATEAEKLVASARESIQNEKAAALNEIKTTVVTLSVEIAEKILKTELEKTGKHEELVDNMLKTIHLN